MVIHLTFCRGKAGTRKSIEILRHSRSYLVGRGGRVAPSDSEVFTTLPEVLVHKSDAAVTTEKAAMVKSKVPPAKAALFDISI